MNTKIVGGGFPGQVNVVQAPGVAGDFASTNPRQTVDAGPGAFVAGVAGTVVGKFAWADSVNVNALNSYGVGLPTGFIHREQQALITVFLDYATMAVPQGLPVTAFSAGDFWVQNDGSVSAVPGMKAYALNFSGGVAFNVTGTPPTAASDSAATLQRIISAAGGVAIPTTNTCTASIANNVLTVAAVGSGSVLGAGQTITGAGIDPAAVVSILNQLTGTAGGIGTYTISTKFSAAVPSTTITMSGGGMTLTGGNTSGVFAIGQTLTLTVSGTLPVGVTITGYGTATAGGAGTYTISAPATVAATVGTVTAANAMFLTVSGASTGVWGLDDILTGTTVSANQSIVATGAQNANLTGLGGAGTYLTNVFQAALTSQTIGVNAGIETTWVATSSGAPGELVKFKNVYNV
jgi:hypothetical protein